MSFFKKMSDKFDDLMGDKEKKKEEKHDDGHRNEQYQPGPQYGSYGGAPPPQQPQFSSGPPQLPPGWISQWDPNSQRYYYLEQSSGRTQWEMPQHYQSGGPPPFQGQPGAPQMGGMGGYQAPGYAGQAPGYAGQPGQYQTNEYRDERGTVHKEFKDTEKKDKGHGGMLAAGAGGLAVGAIGGAVVANAMDDSDDEHHASYAAPPQPQGGYQPQPGYSDQPQLIPPPAGEAGSISSSDKESIEEAREEYEEASSESDREEAREEYNEEVEEAYD